MRFIFSLVFSLIIGAATFAQGYKTKITVAKDGTGDFTNIQDAVYSCKSFPEVRITIYVKNGVYNEKVTIPSWNTQVSLIGESKDSTILTYDDYFGKIKKGPNSTFFTATMLVQANDFELRNITVENSAGKIGQAIALSVEAKRCVVINCKLLGNQDTLYAAGENGGQYYRDCYIEGTTDFIFGEGTALFENCTLMAKSNSFITAASTSQHVPYGFVFKNCVIEAAPGVDKVLLGRPWRAYAKVVFIDTKMGAFIAPAGWNNWSKAANESTAFYAEYNSTGEGANPGKRQKWSKQLTARQAKLYTAKNIFAANPGWDPTTLP